MEDPIFDENMGNTILNQVHDDMRVCDNTGDKIGTVRQVFLGAVSEKRDERGRGPATAPDPEWREDSLIDEIAEVFSAEDPLPEAVRGRLLRHGFIRIDTNGILAADRFALPDQIESVSDDCVRLRVKQDELIEQ